MESVLYGFVLFIIIGIVIYSMIKNKKDKKSGCSSGGGCSGCGRH